MQVVGVLVAAVLLSTSSTFARDSAQSPCDSFDEWEWCQEDVGRLPASRPLFAQAGPRDEELIQKLIDGSPWSGTSVSTRGYKVTSTTSFHRDAQGRLQGEWLTPSLATLQPGRSAGSR